MIKSDKKVKDLASLLATENSILISRGIGMLRDEEPFEGAIALLTSFYDKTSDNSVRKMIESFMNDLKDQSVSKEIMTEAGKPFKQSTISMLISSCWQSGLNYSEYSGEIVEIFLRGDYATALECLTILEESVQDLSMLKRNNLVHIIEDYPSAPADDKTRLTRELISILKNG
jgi:hypothetical protein